MDDFYQLCKDLLYIYTIVLKSVAVDVFKYLKIMLKFMDNFIRIYFSIFHFPETNSFLGFYNYLNSNYLKVNAFKYRCIFVSEEFQNFILIACVSFLFLFSINKNQDNKTVSFVHVIDLIDSKVIINNFKN
jgi:hypothetical protein